MAMDNGYADGSIVVDTTIDSSGFKAGSDKLKRAVDSLAASFDKIGSKVQTALDGDTTSMRALEREAAKLEEQIKKNEAEMEKLGNTKFTTAEFENLSKEVEKATKKLYDLYSRRDKLEALGVDKQSQSWKGLVYDIKAAEENLDRLEKRQTRATETGTAYEMGFNTDRYVQMSAELNTLTAKLAEVEEELAVSQAAWQAIADEKETLNDELDVVKDALKEAQTTLEESTLRAQELQPEVDALLASNTDLTTRRDDAQTARDAAYDAATSLEKLLGVYATPAPEATETPAE